MTLASGGRMDDATILWDWASARILLILHSDRFVSALAFAREGRRLAVGHFPLFGHNPLKAYLWEWGLGRGVQGLHGLTAPVEWVLFSPDRRKVAALSHDWRIAVWDLA